MYEFTQLVFGINAAPFLAQYVSQYHAIMFAQNHPRASETILKSTYTDDSMDSILDEVEGIKLYKELYIRFMAEDWNEYSQMVV